MYLKKRINCIFCGNEFEDYIVNHRKYCSQKCANIASAPVRKKRVILHCEVCQKEISIAPSVLRVRKKIRFCSYKCLSVGMRKPESWTEKVCLECGGTFTVLKVRVNSKFCNTKCWKKWIKKFPPNKKNGYWYENGYKVLYVGDGKGIKEHIKIIQDYIGRKLQNDEVVHHKNHIKTDNRLENLILLSRGEHSHYHRKFEKRNGKHLFGGHNNN